METYERKYKSLVGKIKKAYMNAWTDSTKAVLEGIFPELSESEDERIRKEFCEDIWTFIPNEKAHKYITWLEKQGESYTKKDVDDAYLKGISDAKNELEKQGEQNLANSAKPCDDANDTDEEIVEAVEQKNAEWHGLKLKGRRKYLEGE